MGTEETEVNLHPDNSAIKTRSFDRKRGVVVFGLLVMCLALLAAGCGGATPIPSVASVGSTASSTTSSAASGTSFEKFAACMRAHGVPQFPDPTNNGTTLHIQVGPAQALDPASPQYQSAQAACGSLVPGGLGLRGHTVTPAEQLDYLKAAACVRAHGIADFPDPTITNGQVKFAPPQDINTNSPQVQAAFTICRKLIPAGLPYSN